MGKLPAFQFYPGDWMKDPELRVCSFAARGLWMDVLCVMFELPKRGHLALANGKPLTPDQIARMVGGNPDDVAALLTELESAGVFSRTDDGVIFSRRLDREEHIRRVRSEAGKLGAASGHLGGRPRKPPLTAKLPFAVSLDPCETSPENGKNGKPKGKKTPSSSSSSSSEESGAGIRPPSLAAADEPQKPAANVKKPRERNDLFDALKDVTGCDADGYVGKVAADLAGRDVPYTADDVRTFARRWRELLPWATPDAHPRLTLGIVSKHVHVVRSAPPARDPPDAARSNWLASDEAMGMIFDEAPKGVAPW